MPKDVPSLPTDETEKGPGGDPLGNIRLINLTNDKIELVEFIFGDLLDSVLPDLGDNFSFGIDGKSYFFTVDFFTRLDLSLDVDPYRNEFELKLGDAKSDNVQFSGVDTGALKDPKNPSKGNVKIGPVFTYDIADVVFSIPSPRPNDNSLDTNNNLLAGSDASDAITPRIDIDGLAAYAATQALKIPITTDFNFKVSDTISLDVTLLDVDAGFPDIRLRQDIEITPDELFATVTFTDVSGNPLNVTYTLANGTEVTDNTWSGAWSDFPDLTLTEATVVTPTFSTAANLSQKTGPEFGAGVNVDIGVLQAGVKAPKGIPLVGGDTLFKIKLGPLFEVDFTEDDVIRLLNNLIPGEPIPPDFNFFPIAPGTIQLGEFNSVAGVPYVLDLDTTSDPGLSGFDVTDDNGNKVFVYDPVAADIEALAPAFPIEVTESGRIEIDANDILGFAYDLDAFDTLSLISIGDPVDNNSGAMRGIATLREDGVIVFDTNGEFEALSVNEFGVPLPSLGTSINLEYTIGDLVGRTDTGNLTISVLGENDLPVAVDDYYSMEVQNGFPIFNDGIFGFLDNDIDVDNAEILRNDGETVTSSLGATVSLFQSNSLVYDTTSLPSENTNLQPGEVVFDTINYTLRDQATADNDEGVVGTITIAFYGTEDEVILAQEDLAVSTTALTLIEGEAAGTFAFVLSATPTSDVTVDLTFGDTSEFTLDTNQLVFTADDYFLPQVVTVTPLNDGIVDGSQTVAVTATATSGDGGFNGDTALIDVTVEDAAAIIASTQTLSLDENDAGGTVTITLSRQPATGTSVVLNVLGSDDATATVSPSVLTFDESNWETGLDITVTPIDDNVVEVADFIDITVSIDGALTTDTLFADVDAVVIDVPIDDDENSAPRTGLDTVTTDEETAVNIAVLANDIDPDGDLLTLQSASASAGEVFINADVVTYTPDTDFFGTDLIIYTVSDGNGGTATGIVDVTVNNVDDAPVATDTVLFTGEEVPVSFDLDDLITDVDGNNLTIQIQSSMNGNTVQNADGTYTFTPSENYFNAEPLFDADGNVVFGPDGALLYRFTPGVTAAEVTYSVNDGMTTVTGDIMVVVTPTNDDPVTPTVSFTTDEDTELEIDLITEVLPFVTDPEERCLRDHRRRLQ